MCSIWKVRNSDAKLFYVVMKGHIFLLNPHVKGNKWEKNQVQPSGRAATLRLPLRVTAWESVCCSGSPWRQRGGDWHSGNAFMSLKPEQGLVLHAEWRRVTEERRKRGKISGPPRCSAARYKTIQRNKSRLQNCSAAAGSGSCAGSDLANISNSCSLDCVSYFCINEHLTISCNK